MVLKLPDYTALGPLGETRSGAITPQIRGEEAWMSRAGEILAGAYAKQGAAYGKLADAGGQLIDTAIKAGNENTKLEVARAEAAATTQQIDLENKVYNEEEPGNARQAWSSGIASINEQAAAGIGDPKARELFTLKRQVDAARGTSRVDTYVRQQENQQLVADTAQQIDDNISRIGQARDQDEVSTLIRSSHDQIDGLADRRTITPIAAQKWRRDTASKYGEAWLSGQPIEKQREILDQSLRPRTDGTRPSTTGDRAAGDDSGTAPPAAPAPTRRGDRRSEAVQFFRDQGWSPEQSAAIVGHLSWESGLDPNKSHDGGIGLGVAGWNGDRLKALRQFANEQGRSPTDYKTQLAFVDYELKHGSDAGARRAGKELADSDNIDDATEAFMHYERPTGYSAGDPTAGHGYSGRLAEAKRSLNSAGAVGGSGDDMLRTNTPLDFVPPQRRAQLLNHIDAQLLKQQKIDAAALGVRVQDSTAEALRTGATTPIPDADFVKVYGPEAGPVAIAQYHDNLRLGADMARVSQLSADQQQELLASYQPASGLGYTEALRRRDALAKAVEQATTERTKEFASRIEGSTAEALRTGATTPIPDADFMQVYGKDRAPEILRRYQDILKFSADLNGLGKLSPPEQADLLKRYEPQSGAEFADQAKRQDQLVKALQAVRKERDADPAAFAIQRLPGVSDAWSAIFKAPPELQAQAAATYANLARAEQLRVGVAPQDVRLLPKGRLDDLKSRLDNPEAAGGPDGLVNTIRAEAALWGKDNWPQVYRELAPNVEPVVRVIGSGVGDTAARTLAQLAPMKVGDILKDQSAEKANQVKRDVQSAFQPLIGTMGASSEGLSVFNDFREQAEKLSAYYIVRGMDSGRAATKAYNDLIGDRYDFRDGWRSPKGLAQSADDIQFGTTIASSQLGRMDLDLPRDNIGGLSQDYLRKSQADTLRRDGQWVTAPDESGLMLTYKDEAVRRADGRPLIMSWDELGALAARRKTEDARDYLELRARSLMMTP